MDRLTADDRLMLWSDELWPQDVGVLAVLEGSPLLEPDGRFRIDAVREAVERRLHLLPRFRQILHVPRTGLGWPLWVDAPRFEVGDHVRMAQLPAPGDEAQFLETVEQLRRHRLDRSRPLWEMWFLPGLPEARVGLFIRLHHVMGDGIAEMANLGSLLDAAPGATWGSVQPWTPSPLPAARDLLGDNLQRRAGDLRRAFGGIAHPTATLRHARAGWPALRELVAAEPGPRTSLDRLVGQDRSLALVRTSLELVKGVAHARGATVNDVLLAVTAGGLRGLLESRGEPVEAVTLPIYVPVALRRDSPGQARGNLISQIVVRLPLGTSDPEERLDRIAAETAHRKAMVRPSLGAVFRNRVTGGAMLRLVVRQRVNVVSADLPGPQSPLYFAGAQVLEAFPLLNLIGNVSLGVGALSYAGQLHVMAVGDAAAHPDIEVFVAGVRDELRTLAEAGRAG